MDNHLAFILKVQSLLTKKPTLRFSSGFFAHQVGVVDVLTLIKLLNKRGSCPIVRFSPTTILLLHHHKCLSVENDAFFVCGCCWGLYVKS